MSARQPILVACMGVSGCGKSTVARALADILDMSWVEADDHHPPENIARMAAGQPLSDEHREPWMNRLCAVVGEALRTGNDCALAFSGLRRIHRDRMRTLGYPVLYLHLHGEQDVIAARMAARTGHFMPPALLASQYHDLDPTDAEPDVIDIDVSVSVEQVIEQAVEATRDFLRANGRRSET
ncbi:gluconokinase [Marinihelvus fidelis]|uniref:Gluconokinase n=1 Tax=Marinihelvus fidelis TaxID=2613842 RepID=A0A5N0T6F4_9GAMM|nr:gluconokinase [Marinihelvus fidelis]KAA9130543.1 gluconokinase [Marinihelvus fidelis]